MDIIFVTYANGYNFDYETNERNVNSNQIDENPTTDQNF